MTGYRILSLSGGGVRGVFQARYLELLEAELGPLRHQFDMIAATSTGALVGLALASGISAGQVTSLYRDHAAEIFSPRRLSPFRKGGRYDSKRLRELLTQMYGNARLGDLDSAVVVVASEANTYEGHVFTESNSNASLVDVALASSAAPTYFPAVVPTGEARGYLDGGLWANDPSFVSLGHAIHVHGVDPQDVRLLSVGTGKVQQGQTAQSLNRMRTLSVDSFKLFLDTTFALQSWAAEKSCNEVLEPSQVVRINPHLQQWIPLDDVRAALETLIPLAESQAEREADNVRTLLSGGTPRVARSVFPDISLEARRVLAEAGITHFTPSRRYYSEVRNGRESISSYVALATETLTMVSINLATGMDLEEVVDTFEAMVRRPSPVKICVSLLDPERPALMEAVAAAVNRTPAALGDRINETAERLHTFVSKLPTELQAQIELRFHAALPSASAIMLDEGSSRGLIQLETKAYRANWLKSFGFEVRAGTDFFDTLRTSYRQLIDDGRPMSMRDERGDA